jgi:GT2 family glycosyltransferase
MDRGGWDEIIEQDFVTGCCFLAPRSTFETIGLFDEQFTMYYEDFDFSFRVRESGEKILVIPEAKAWHNVSTSSGGRDTPNERYWMARSSIVFFRKHTRGSQRVLITIWRLGSAIRTTLRLLLSGRIPSISAYWRGLWDGLRQPSSRGS